MATKIKLIRSIEYLHTTTEGDIDLEKSKEILSDIAKAARPPADFDIILDFRRSQLKLATFEIYSLAVELSNHKDTYKYKIAVLVLPGLDFDKAEFFELCTNNRGIHVDVFTNYEDAVEWFYTGKE